MKKWLGLLIVTILFPFSFLFAEESAAPKLTSYVFNNPSEVGFKAKATLHSFRGKTDTVSGRFELDLAHLGKPGRGALELRAKGLDTQDRKRDKKMWSEYLETQKYPLIRFVVQQARLEFDDPIQKKADYVLTGELDLHGIKKSVEMVATLDYKQQDNLKIEGYVPVKMTDYLIPVPAFAKIFKLKEEVRVTFNLTATPGS